MFTSERFDFICSCFCCQLLVLKEDENCGIYTFFQFFKADDIDTWQNKGWNDRCLLVNVNYDHRL